MDDELKAAVGASYRVFGRYAFRGDGGGPADGIGPLELRLLRLTPPGEVSRELAAAYAAAFPALMDPRCADDLRSLLPRLLEFVADGDLPARDALALLDLADFRARWPEEEAATVERFLAAFSAAEPGAPG